MSMRQSTNGPETGAFSMGYNIPSLTGTPNVLEIPPQLIDIVKLFCRSIIELQVDHKNSSQHKFSITHRVKHVNILSAKKKKRHSGKTLGSFRSRQNARRSPVLTLFTVYLKFQHFPNQVHIRLCVLSIKCTKCMV